MSTEDFNTRLDELFQLDEGLMTKLIGIGAMILGSSFVSQATERDITKDIVRHEGNKDLAYTDTVGKRSIGIGFNIDDNESFARKILGKRFDNIYDGKEPLNVVDKQTFFDYSLRNALSVATKYLPNFEKQPEEVKEIILNMAFNLGNRLHKFEKTKTYIQAKDYKNASKEMLRSKWAKQVKNRAKELADKMSQIK